MRALALAGSVLLSLPAFACINGMREEQRKTNEAELLVLKASDAIDNREWKTAVKHAQKALESPAATAVTKKQAKRYLAFGQLHTGELKQARAALLELIAEKDEPSLQARLGEAEVGLGLFEDGRRRLESLFERLLLPDADATVALAKARLAGGDVEGAKAAVKAALQQEPQHPGALALQQQLEKPAPAGKKSAPTRS